MSILDRLETLAVKVDAYLPQGVKKMTIVVEQHAAAEATALEREASAVKNAIVPEGLEAVVGRLENAFASHFADVESFLAQHAGLAQAKSAVDAAFATAPAETSDAVPAATSSDAIPPVL